MTSFVLLGGPSAENAVEAQLIASFSFFFFFCVCVCVLTLVASATLMKTATKLSVTAQLITFFFFHFFFFCLQHILHKRRLFSFIERQYLLSFSFFSLFALRWTHFRMPSMPS